MKLLIDTHTHTVASGHAFSTLLENITFAGESGLDGIVITEHAESIPGASPSFIISIAHGLDDVYDGVRVYKGAELNIIDYEGGVDVIEDKLRMLDFAIASMHTIVLKPGGRDENTAALVGALNNPYVDIIGHPGNGSYPIHAEELVLTAKKLDKLLEVNNHSFLVRKGSAENCRVILELCKKHGVRICVGSDAHFCRAVGRFPHAVKLIEEVGYPEEMIVSRNKKAFDEYLKERQRRLSDLDK